MDKNSYSQTVEEIKERCNIVDVIGSVVSLKKAGNNYKGCCPFHKEKTPSFVVSESKQYFHCFGCGASGDVLSFVQRHYNIGFADAVEKLAASCGVEIKRTENVSGKKKDVYYDTNKKAARFFYDSLTKKANDGYTYMKNRKMEPAVMQKFGIGFADAEWNTLSDHLIKEGVSKSILLELGLSSSAKDGRIYDKYRNRVIFPIIDTKGKVIGFGGRIIGEGEPKYLNSQESIVFSKKNNLYGLNITKSEIQKEGFAILVEGYMDCVALYQGGVKNVAASLGTALTEQQAKLLKRYTDKVYLCYDSDGPGTKAAFVGIDVLRAAGAEVRVIQVDDGKDPDEYIKKHGRDAFMNIINNKSMSDVDYKISVIRKRHNLNDTSGGIRFLEETASVLRKLTPVEQDIYIQKYAREYRISEGALKKEVERTSSAPEPKVYEPAESSEKPAAFKIDPAALQIEKNLIRLILSNSDYFRKLDPYPECFISPEGIALRDALAKFYIESEEYDINNIREDLKENELAYLEEILSLPVGEKTDEAFDDCIKQLEKRRAKQRQLEIEKILSLADDSVDPGPLNELMKEYTELQKIQKGR